MFHLISHFKCYKHDSQSTPRLFLIPRSHNFPINVASSIAVWVVSSAEAMWWMISLISPPRVIRAVAALRIWQFSSSSDIFSFSDHEGTNSRAGSMMSILCLCHLFLITSGSQIIIESDQMSCAQCFWSSHFPGRWQLCKHKLHFHRRGPLHGETAYVNFPFSTSAFRSTRVGRKAFRKIRSDACAQRNFMEIIFLLMFFEF